MGWITMSEWDLQPLEVLGEVLAVAAGLARRRRLWPSSVKCGGCWRTTRPAAELWFTSGAAARRTGDLAMLCGSERWSLSEPLWRFRPDPGGGDAAGLAIPPARPDDLHRPLTLAPDQLRQVLCWREQRHVGQQLTLSYERKLIMLEETELTRGLVGQYVDTDAYADGRLEVRWKGVALSYRAFDKDQRVTQADVVENKRLSAALAQVKEMQESRPPPRVKTNSEKNGYRKTGRRKRESGTPDQNCAAD